MWMQPQSTEEDEDLERLLAEVSQPMPEPRDSVEPLPDKLAQDDAVQQFHVPDMEQQEPQPIAAVEVTETTIEPAYNAGRYDLPTTADDPRFADARQSPIARVEPAAPVAPPTYPQERPELPDQRPSAVPQDAGPSPMWQKYSAQGAHMTPGSGPGAGLSALASRSSGGYGGPPMAEAPNTGLLALAAGADFLLNRGQNVGPLLGMIAKGDNTDYRNYRRQMQHAKDMAGIEALARRGQYGRGGYANPEAMDLRRRNTELAEARFGRQQALDQIAADRRDPNSEVSRRAAERALELHPELEGRIVPGQISVDELDKDPTIRAELQEIKDQHRYKIWQREEQIRQGHAFERMDEAQSNALERQDYAEGKQIAKEGREEGRKEAGREVLGYTRRPDAPRIGEEESKKLRETAASMSKLENVLDRLIAIDSTISAEERAMAAAGKTTPTIAEAQQLQQEAASMVRQIANFGTPQAAELAITYARIPEIASVNGWMNGRTQYGALKNVMRRQVDNELGAYGYTRGEPLRARTIEGGAPSSGDGSLGVTTGAPPKADSVVGSRPRSRRASKDPGTQYPEVLRPDQTPRPRRPGTAAAQPVQQGTGRTRNGKPVLRTERATAPDGTRVRVVFYTDGTHEVVR